MKRGASPAQHNPNDSIRVVRGDWLWSYYEEAIVNQWGNYARMTSVRPHRRVSASGLNCAPTYGSRVQIFPWHERSCRAYAPDSQFVEYILFKCRSSFPCIPRILFFMGVSVRRSPVHRAYVSDLSRLDAIGVPSVAARAPPSKHNTTNTYLFLNKCFTSFQSNFNHRLRRSLGWFWSSKQNQI